MRPSTRIRSVAEQADATWFVLGMIATTLGKGVLGDLKRTSVRDAPAQVRRTRFDPTDPDGIADPHSHFRSLRTAGVAVNERLNVWMLTRHEHVNAAARHHEILSSAQGIFLNTADIPSVLTRDRPDHTRIRDVAKPHFTPKKMATLEGEIQRIAAPVIDRLGSGEIVDFAHELARPLPITVIAHLLGVPEDDWETFREWSDSLAHAFAPTSILQAVRFSQEVTGAIIRLETLVRREIAKRSTDPREDFFLHLQRAEEAGTLDRLEVLLYAAIIVVAGNETTTNLLGILAERLSEDPELYERVRGDRSLVPAVVDEALRWGSPVQWVTRVTTAPYPVGDLTIPTGSRVVLYYASANRDPRKFSDPDRFDIDRDHGGNLSFGVGPHFCLGAHLARLEACTVLNQLLDAVPRLAPAGPVRWGTVPSLHGPTSVPIRRVVG